MQQAAKKKEKLKQKEMFPRLGYYTKWHISIYCNKQKIIQNHITYSINKIKTSTFAEVLFLINQKDN